MDENCIYNCEVCGNSKEKNKTDMAPECCGKPMKMADPLEPCRTSETAEHFRFDQPQEPCNDARG